MQKLTPKHLDFSTPKSGSLRQQSEFSPVSVASIHATPSSTISDVDSMSSVDTGTSNVTPKMAKMSIGRGRGRPRKPIECPTVHDYPVGGTQEEINRYIKKKNTQMWRYKKLTSTDSSEYRAAENERVKNYNKRKKGENSGDSQDEHQKQLSRER